MFKNDKLRKISCYVAVVASALTAVGNRPLIIVGGSHVSMNVGGSHVSGVVDEFGVYMSGSDRAIQNRAVKLRTSGFVEFEFLNIICLC
jgi:hypothetical protein